MLMQGMVVQCSAVIFDYEDGPRGPAKWGDLKPAWAVCKRGVRQSPMFITADTMVTDPRLGNLDAKFTSKCVPSNISNDGHEVEVIPLFFFHQELE